jgi:hypothetical protein
LPRAGPLGLIDCGTTGPGIDRLKCVVVGERIGVQELELMIAIQDPEVAVAASMGCRLYKLSVDLRIDQEGRGYLIPVPAVVRGVLVIALDLAGVGIEREGRIRVKIVPRPIVGNPRRRIPGTPVSRV